MLNHHTDTAHHHHGLKCLVLSFIWTHHGHIIDNISSKITHCLPVCHIGLYIITQDPVTLAKSHPATQLLAMLTTHSRPGHTSHITSSYTAPCNADDPLKTRSHWSHHIQLHSSLQCWRPTRDPVTLVSSHPATQLHSLPTTHLCSTASNLETLTTVLAKWNLSFNLNLGTRDNVPISWYPSQCALSYQTVNGKCGHK